MRYTFRSIRTISIAFCFFVIIGVNIVAVPALYNYPQTRAKPTETEYIGWDLPRKIGIFYDPNHDLLVSTAFNTFSSAAMIYHNTYILPIESKSDLRTAINDLEYWIKLYFINGTLQGVNIGSDLVAWESISRMLSRSQYSYHIFSSGSTDLLRKVVPLNQTNVRIESSPVIDAELSYFYSLWEIGEILDNAQNGIRYQECGEDFRIFGVKYFARNMEKLVNGVADPDNIPNPLGSINEAVRLRDWNAKLAKMNDAYQVLPDNSIRYFNETETPVPNTSLKISPAVKEDPNTFTIADIPLFSGLEGSSADIIDAVLNVLIKTAGNKLSIDEGLAIDIVNTIKQIGLIFSDQSEGEGDVKETIKGILEAITAIAPIPESLKPFIPIVVDGLYLLRGEISDIIDFSKSTISAVFSLASSVINSSSMQSILSILEATFMNGAEIVERIFEAEKEADEQGKQFEPITVIIDFAVENS